ncbi:FKBP-type peptidyl-prolyl cis-trans isomerase N-terminal domain-containing protein [Winslowiella toletana]|uniref:FKBP-type peptidyl-prolyl cis-trans isomerase N-terminal domain-containing protein n=1 Tax=Winslowiella toletana TaxID=92490 RepID=UPI0028BEB80F|nr:FKBP-type peptidyl-prolyl cis-trans isomerase N-terminal domain-containing protein [Winslowiella toletana]WNN46686.1 FKBP-type peptidyl-prolyl cis-trans isomerase N-terminal domain-containing protein [Winslowiella toletana]
MMLASEGCRISHLRQLIILLPLILMTQTVRANEETSELLKFAVQYLHEKEKSANTVLPALKNKQQKIMGASTSQACSSEHDDLVAKLKQRDTQLNEQRLTLHELETRLTELNRAMNTAGARENKLTTDYTKRVMNADFTTVWQMLSRFRNLLPGSLSSDSRNASLFETLQLPECSYSDASLLLEELRQENRTLTDSVVQKNDALNTLRQEKQAAEASLSAPGEQDEWLKKRSSHEAIVADLRSQLETLNRERGVLTDSIAQKDDALNTLRQEKQVAEAGLSAFTGQAALCKREQEEWLKELSLHEAIVADLKSQLEMLNRESGDLADSIVQKDDALNTLRQEKQAAEASLSVLTEQAGLSKLELKERLKDQASQEAIVVDLNAQLGVLRQENGILKESIIQKSSALDVLQKHTEEVDSRMLRQDQEVTRLRDEVKGLQDRAQIQIKPGSLKKAEERRAYAAGDVIGHDIINMLEERKSWGIKTDSQIVLAGIIDAFSGHHRLSNDELTKALSDSQVIVAEAREKASMVQKKNSAAFVANFKKKKGVKYSTTGFWYLIDYAGDDRIAENAIIDLVVKESLADGTVVHDMAMNDKVLSQPLKLFPPIFREAISHLQNHGSLTMLVPPELAYGKDGYPPKIPPDATMIYELRIDNISESDNKKSYPEK